MDFSKSHSSRSTAAFQKATAHSYFPKIHSSTKQGLSTRVYSTRYPPTAGPKLESQIHRAVFSSSKNALCKKKILRHIKFTMHAWRTKAQFSSQKILQNFLDSPSHRIFGHMHEALNIDTK
jgi:hypothetical protein